MSTRLNLTIFPILCLTATLLTTINSYAQSIYQKQFHNSSEYISDFEIMNDTAIYYFGRHKDCNSCPHNTLIVKTDMLSNVQWSYKYGPELTGVDASRVIDGFVIFGSTTNDYFILKIDFEGNLQWSKRYGTSMYEYMGSMRQRIDGNITICGTSKTDFGTNDTTYLNWLLLDSTGTLIDSKFYQVDKRFSVSDFTIDANSSTTILVGSIVEPGTQLSEGVLATIDSTGSLMYFNAFYENIVPMSAIDHAVTLDKTLYTLYTQFMREQLDKMPIGTRLATYFSFMDEVPNSYKIKAADFDVKLKFWEKVS